MRVVFFASWLSLIFFFQILSGLNVWVVSGQCLSDQRSFLLRLKNSLVYDSSISTKLVSWDQKDCCLWGGVTCNLAGQVTGLDLNNESITGGIGDSSSLFRLKFLRELNLAYNNFNSTEIPKGLVNLAGLTNLNLSNAWFGGQIPIEISRLTRLTTLDFSSLFAGSCPLKLENPSLSMLVQNLGELGELRLDGVDISTAGSDWSRALSSSLPKLRVLSLCNCNIPGPIHSSLAKLEVLSVIQLSQNSLNTSVTEFFADFRNLTVLRLSSCELNGLFPERIFQIPTLQILDVSDNEQLHGSFPEFLENVSLQALILSKTKFSGRIPDSIVKLANLSRIDLASCNFSGSIPDSVANLTQLYYVDFSFNQFTGSVPSFSSSKNLTQIILSHNTLTGKLLSSNWNGLHNLVNLDLRENSLRGSIPLSLFSLPSLQKLLLSNNLFDAILNDTSNVSSVLLDTLDLSSNNLTGPIPSFLFELQGLKFLALSSNNFNGLMNLTKIQNLKNLTSLDLSHNKLSVDVIGSNTSVSSFPLLSTLKLASCNLDAFPNFLNTSKLSKLDLSNNRIHGKIPKWVWNIGNGLPGYLNLSYNQLDDFEGPSPHTAPSLNVLDLRSNLLQGQIPIVAPSAIVLDYSNNSFSSIPENIGHNMTSTIYFCVSRNRINGTIPTSLCSATYLEVLDLSTNMLSGIIPKCVIQMATVLGVLNLRLNGLNGIIPEAFPNRCALKTLDVSGNQIEGQIPNSLANCTMLEVLNVGNNKLIDAFPCFLKNSSSLRVLVLRSNKFHGSISCKTGNQTWPNLQIIDIASNSFNGNLPPKCFLRWSAMTNVENDAVSKVKHLQFEILQLSRFYYQDTVKLTNKGVEMNLVKILTVFTSIDFSNNQFEGFIPETVGYLKSLYVLNLSHNALTGPIPVSIGNLTQLGSLDLSYNKLNGTIATELVGLTFLSLLNLSYNHLVGWIPTGAQFGTFSKDSYLGNAGLCGLPLNNVSCDNSTKKSTPYDSGLTAAKSQLDWHFIFTGLGYGVGAAMVIVPLVLCDRGRKCCNKHIDKLCSMITKTVGHIYPVSDDMNANENIQEEREEDDAQATDEEKSVWGRYCVFCTKLDVRRKKVIHYPKCTCRDSPRISSSSSSSLFSFAQNL